MSKCYNFVLKFYQITEIIGTQGGTLALIEFVINDNYNYSLISLAGWDICGHISAPSTEGGREFR